MAAKTNCFFAIQKILARTKKNNCAETNYSIALSQALVTLGSQSCKSREAVDSLLLEKGLTRWMQMALETQATFLTEGQMAKALPRFVKGYISFECNSGDFSRQSASGWLCR